MILLREISLSFIHQPLRLVPLLTDLRHVLADIDNVLQEKPKEGRREEVTFGSQSGRSSFRYPVLAQNYFFILEKLCPPAFLL